MSATFMYQMARSLAFVNDMFARFGEYVLELDARMELDAWVRYDRAGAPYGYMRAGLRRWEREETQRILRGTRRPT